MSGLGAGHVQQGFLEFSEKSEYVRFSRIFGLEIDIDDLHFTDSSNASPLII
jgi:hypothetical protein